MLNSRRLWYPRQDSNRRDAFAYLPVELADQCGDQWIKSHEGGRPLTSTPVHPESGPAQNGGRRTPVDGAGRPWVAVKADVRLPRTRHSGSHSSEAVSRPGPVAPIHNYARAPKCTPQRGRVGWLAVAGHSRRRCTSAFLEGMLESPTADSGPRVLPPPSIQCCLSAVSTTSRTVLP